MNHAVESLALSRRRSDERLRASLQRLNAVARSRLRHSREQASAAGHTIIRELVDAEIFILVGLAFGVGLLLGRRR